MVQSALNISCSKETVPQLERGGVSDMRMVWRWPVSGLIRHTSQANPWLATRSTGLPDSTAGKSSVTETMPQKLRWPDASVKYTGSRPAMPMPPWMSGKGPAIYNSPFSMAAWASRFPAPSSFMLRPTAFSFPARGYTASTTPPGANSTFRTKASSNRMGATFSKPS